jgi:hypothetical protein
MSRVTDYLAAMERDITAEGMWTEAQVEVWANRYWAIRWDKTLSEEEKKAKLAEHDKEFRPVRKVHVNDSGNTVVRRHRDAERYLFDFDDDFRAAGWKQFDTDQDAWYFGVWVNPKTLRTLTYAEGDVTLVVCSNAEHYNAEIKDACEFYGEGYEFIACDMEGFEHIMLGTEPRGEIEVARQNRQRFFAPV